MYDELDELDSIMKSPSNSELCDALDDLNEDVRFGYNSDNELD